MGWHNCNLSIGMLCYLSSCNIWRMRHWEPFCFLRRGILKNNHVSWRKCWISCAVSCTLSLKPRIFLCLMEVCIWCWKGHVCLRGGDSSEINLCIFFFLAVDIRFICSITTLYSRIQFSTFAYLLDFWLLW